MSKKKHLKPAVKRAFLSILAVSLIGFGSYQLYSIYDSQKHEQEKSAEVVKQLEDKFLQKDSGTDNTSAGTEVSKELKIEGDVVGIMYIPAFNNFQHAIAMGVTNDVLANYVGMYTSFGMIGENNSNAVFSSHSATYGYSPIAFFNRIDDVLKEGDEIDILWHDGMTYKYVVTSIRQNCDPSDRSSFEQPTDGSQMITLQTCTHGDPNHRSFIQAVRSY